MKAKFISSTNTYFNEKLKNKNGNINIDLFNIIFDTGIKGCSLFSSYIDNYKIDNEKIVTFYTLNSEYVFELLEENTLKFDKLKINKKYVKKAKKLNEDEKSMYFKCISNNDLNNEVVSKITFESKITREEALTLINQEDCLDELYNNKVMYILEPIFKS